MIGVVISSAGQIQYLATGILIQSAQIAFDAYKNALQQLSLNGKINLSPLAALYYFAPICTLSGVAGVVVFERGALQKAWPPKIPLWVVLSNGMITFSLNIVIGIMVGNFLIYFEPLLIKVDQENLVNYSITLRDSENNGCGGVGHAILSHPSVLHTRTRIFDLGHWYSILLAVPTTCTAGKLLGASKGCREDSVVQTEMSHY